MADDEHADLARPDDFVGFGATNVPTSSAAEAFDGFGGFGPAPAVPAPAVEEAVVDEPPAIRVDGTRSVHKRRRSAGSTEPVEPDTWIVVRDTTDEAEVAHLSTDLRSSGIQTWVRVDSDFSAMTGLERHVELLVPETEAALAEAMIEDTLRERVEFVPFEDDPQPGDELFQLRDRVAAEMPGASPRQIERAYRSRRAEIAPHHGLLGDMPIGIFALIIAGVIAFALLLSLFA